MSEVLARVLRQGMVESIHRGSIAVVDISGGLVWSVGDPDTYTFMRSAAKPIQALAVVESGAHAAFGLTQPELAVICSSHSAEAHHVAAVLGILGKLGLNEEHLQCGIHAPSHPPAAEELIRAGRKPTPVHCNCSGKHAGMLAVCRHLGWDLGGYIEAEHPVQQLNLDSAAAVTGYPRESIGLARDSCGVPVYALPLRHMALAFARLANPGDPRSGFSPSRAEAAELIVQAMRRNPEMISASSGLCSNLMRHVPVVAKSGAEAVYCFGVPGHGIGCALKIEDGNSRAVAPVVVEILRELGVLTLEAAAAFEQHLPQPRNHHGQVSGRVEAVRLRRTGHVQ